MSDQKPVWRHGTPEEFARWVYNNPIVKITHHWKMTGEDTSTEWVMLHPKDGNPRKAPKIADNSELRFHQDHKGLVQLRSDVSDTVVKIWGWEINNERKLAEYNKLKDELGL